MKKNILFIVNPISGIGKQNIIDKMIVQHLNHELFDYKVAYTKAPKHATDLALQAANSNIDIVAIVGGDGSINEAGKGLLNSNTALAVIPTGSGNGFANHLIIPTDIKKAIEVINTGKTILIDTVRFNNDTFLNVAGVGFDALIGWEFSKLSTRGFSSYIKTIFKNIPNLKKKNYQLTYNGKTENKKAYLICIANGSQWGNNAWISPESIINDGIIELAIVKKITLFNIIPATVKLLSKKPQASNCIEIIKTKKVEIIQSDTIAHIDGEPITSGKNILIEVLPKSLNVIIP